MDGAKHQIKTSLSKVNFLARICVTGVAGDEVRVSLPPLAPIFPVINVVFSLSFLHMLDVHVCVCEHSRWLSLLQNAIYILSYAILHSRTILPHRSAARQRLCKKARIVTACCESSLNRVLIAFFVQLFLSER
uniref:Transmembrane protein n=1 Tax=Mesocestoides corti TaxID=53468 RepID=A0A5K3FY94_MESCO